MGFLYDPAKLGVEESKVFSHAIVKRVATRDIVQVNFLTKPSNKRFVIIGNHWPVRSEGTFQ